MKDNKKVSEEVLAVISAAVEVVGSRNGVKLVIKSFRRLQNSCNVWSNTGKIERMRSSL